MRCARAVLASAAPVCPHSSAHHTGLGTRFAARLLLPVSIIFGGYRLGAARVASADNESHSRRDVSGDVSNAHALRRRSPPSRDDRTRSTSAHTVLLAGFTFTCTGVGTVEEKTAFLHEYLYGTSLAISDLWWCRAPSGGGRHRQSSSMSPVLLASTAAPDVDVVSAADSALRQRSRNVATSSGMRKCRGATPRGISSAS